MHNIASDERKVFMWCLKFSKIAMIFWSDQTSFVAVLLLTVYIVLSLFTGRWDIWIEDML